MEFKNFVATVKDFPKEGIMFRDITPLVRDGNAYHECIDVIAKYGEKVGATVVVGPEARGFIFGCPVAYKLNIGFSPVRKPGKLPRDVITCDYSLEYGTNTLCLLNDAVSEGDKVLIVDDLLATGGTLKACIELVEKLGAEVVGIACPIELPSLGGRKLLEGYDVFTMIEYEGD